jgi:predicted RNase H-like HicB family nuclease
MASQPVRRSERASYTVVAEPMAADAWHVTVRELPATWTVAFSRDDLEGRARERIALDLECHPDDFDVRIVTVMP